MNSVKYVTRFCVHNCMTYNISGLTDIAFTEYDVPKHDHTRHNVFDYNVLEYRV